MAGCPCTGRILIQQSCNVAWFRLRSRGRCRRGQGQGSSRRVDRVWRDTINRGLDFRLLARPAPSMTLRKTSVEGVWAGSRRSVRLVEPDAGPLRQANVAQLPRAIRPQWIGRHEAITPLAARRRSPTSGSVSPGCAAARLRPRELVLGFHLADGLDASYAARNAGSEVGHRRIHVRGRRDPSGGGVLDLKASAAILEQPA